ncbi:hypothetical protein OHD16_21395 [Sphingobacterium sp. ML3W]|uniref:hypothetical protein n=1 Tax=Sphingobacterium sp. ML3W TaxID=1538644 RepID=UPI00249BC277|nr:hypothetical protein [Sphingobacterium sp. ML3W]WFA77287.1 hypothetical protein OGI71_14535 [Sphingobacterium sp. ML3W]
MEKIFICMVTLLFIGAKPIEEKPLEKKWSSEFRKFQSVGDLKNDLIELDSLCGKLSE